jgi:hypothetical protein
MSSQARNTGIVNASRYVKHSFSCLPDLMFDVMIDHDHHVVTLASDAFDSNLVGWLVTQILPAVHGVVAFRDDDAGWHPPLPPYRLRIRVGGGIGIEFDAQVVKLASAIGGGVAVQLTNPQLQRMSQGSRHEPQGSGGTP